MIKYGLKIWSTDKKWFISSVDLFKQGKVDFGELYIVPGSFELEELASLKQMPFSLHGPHFIHGFNLLGLTDEQVKLFQEQVLKTADFLNSPFIVVHPGVGDSKEAFRENSAKIADKKVLIETMAKIGFVGQGGNKIDEGVVCFGHSKEQLEFIRQECGFEICLDMAHSTAAASSLGIPYKEFLRSLVDSLNPSYFHISGGYEKEKEDKHLDVFEGNLDIKWIKGLLEKKAKQRDIYLVFETPKTGGALENDIKNIDYFKSL